nr:MAG TPA: hypothetical protein [Caudoviricetes sp.]
MPILVPKCCAAYPWYSYPFLNCKYIVIFSFCLEYCIVFVTNQETKISSQNSFLKALILGTF